MEMASVSTLVIVATSPFDITRRGPLLGPAKNCAPSAKAQGKKVGTELSGKGLAPRLFSSRRPSAEACGPSIDGVSTVKSKGHNRIINPVLYHLVYNGPYKVRKRFILRSLAPRHGFEPRFTAPKAAVLPLDDRGILRRTALQCSVLNVQPATPWRAGRAPLRTGLLELRVGSQSWPVLGAGFKPVVRYSVSRVGSTPTGFRHLCCELPYA